MSDIVERIRTAYEQRSGAGHWDIMCEAAAEIERRQADTGLALREATRLLESFVGEHFPPNPDWKPLPDLIGVLSQLSNAVVVARDLRREIERLQNIIIRGLAGVELSEENDRLINEIERLRAALVQVMDVCGDNPSIATNFIDEVAGKALVSTPAPGSAAG
jgi:hypothetical protein